MQKAIELKPDEATARWYVDSLILAELSEMESVVKLGDLAERLSKLGIDLSVLRAHLTSNPDRFAYNERRWIPAARAMDQGKSVVEIMVDILVRASAPLRKGLISKEVARIKNLESEEADNIVERIGEFDPRFATAQNGLIALSRWTFQAHDENLDRALNLNCLTMAEVETVLSRTGKVDWLNLDEVTDALRKAAPVSLKAFAGAAYATLYDPDPKSTLLYSEIELFEHLLALPDFLLAGDGALYPRSKVKEWTAAAKRVSEKLAPSIEVEDAVPIEVKSSDLKRMAERVVDSGGTVTATRLLQDVYEVTPTNRTFPDDLANLVATLKADHRIQWVGGDRFRKVGDVPEELNELPDVFQFKSSGIVDEEGELVDVELTDEGLSVKMRSDLRHPLAMDVLDEDPIPAPKQTQDTMRFVLKSIHRELGTFPLVQFPAGWIEATPNEQELIFIQPDGTETQAWLSNNNRLLMNLFDLWFAQPVESGAVFTLTRTARPIVFEFAWMEEPDPVMYLSSQRMEDLRALGQTHEGRSTFELLQSVMTSHPKGAEFLTLLGEINVGRRTTRRLLASLLSGYECFYQRSGSPVWHYDAKKVVEGFDKSKRRFVRK